MEHNVVRNCSGVDWTMPCQCAGYEKQNTTETSQQTGRIAGENEKEAAWHPTCGVC